MPNRPKPKPKKPAKRATKPKRKPMRDMSPAELMELAFVRSRAWNQPPPEPARTRLADPVFGRLRWDAIWHGSVSDSPFGKKVPLMVEVLGDGAEPSPQQREAFAEYRKVEKKLFPQVERMLFDSFVADRDEALSYPPIRNRLLRLPDPKKAADIWRLAKVDAIVVPIQQKKKGNVVMVDFAVAWDPEHGTRAMIQDGKLKRLMDPGAGY